MWDRLYPYKIGGLRGVRKDVRTIVVVLAVLVGMPVITIRAIGHGLQPRPTDLPDFQATVFHEATGTAINRPTATATSTAIPTATWTPTNTATPDYASVGGLATPPIGVPIDTFALSFYDPGIGADVFGFVDQAEYEKLATINCLEWDFENRQCLSRVNHGRDGYEIWFRKGAACSDVLPYGTLFYVIEPEPLRGYWRCIDRGALDVNGLHYIDFMLDYPGDLWTGPNIYDFPFNSPVKIQVVN